MGIKKHQIEVYPFAFNKILSNDRKIDVRPYTKNMHDIAVGDMVDYVNLENKESVVREVKGIALFDDFETMINMLSPELIGYKSRKEVMLRVERMYSKDIEQKNGVMAIFLDIPKVKHMMSFRVLGRVD